MPLVTTNGGAFSVARNTAHLAPDGSLVVQIDYSSPASGMLVSRVLNVPANPSNPITDAAGNVVSATVPTALANAIAALASQLDSNISAGASGGKLNL
jgi:hypothetical protein